MTNTTWVLKGTEYGSCNCDYGCPCQFMGKPSSPDGDCRHVTFNYIDDGHYREVAEILKQDRKNKSDLINLEAPVIRGLRLLDAMLDPRPCLYHFY